MTRIPSCTGLRLVLPTIALFFLPTFSAEDCAELSGVFLKSERLGSDSSVYKIERYLYDPDTNLVRIEHEDLSLNYSWAYEFLRNHRGEVVTALFYDSRGEVGMRVELTLDSLGRAAAEARYTEDGLHRLIANEYNSDGNLSMVSTYDENMELIDRKELRYDELGRHTFDTLMRLDPTKNLYTRYEYDSNGKLISEISRNVDDSVVAREELERDACGYPVFIRSATTMLQSTKGKEGIPDEDSNFYDFGKNTVWHVKKNCRKRERTQCSHSFQKDYYGVPDTFITLENTTTGITPLAIHITGDTLEIDLPKPFGRTVAIPVQSTPDKRIVSFTNLTPDDDTLGRVLRFFDDKTQPVRKELRSPDGVLRRYTEDTYDSIGRHTARTAFSSAGTEQFRMEFEYDSLGRMSGISRFENDALNSIVSISYDSDGRVSERRVYNGSMFFTRRHEFEYDTAGRRVSHTVEDATAGTVIRTIVFSYDEQNRCRMVELYDALDSLEGTISYIYDSQDALQRIEAEGYMRVVDGAPVVKREYLSIGFNRNPETMDMRVDFAFGNDSAGSERDYYTVFAHGDPGEHLTAKPSISMSGSSQFSLRAIHGSLLVNLPEGPPDNLRMSVFDMRGRQVARYNQPDIRGGTVVSLNHGGRLCAGNYIAEINFNSLRHSTIFQVRD